MDRKYRLATLGCKVNQYESQQIREILDSFSLRPARRGESADIAVVNTCAVTATAERKNRQIIRRVSEGGKTPVIVVGCGAGADAERIRAISGVVAIFGHDGDIQQKLSAELTRRFRERSVTRRRSLPAGVGTRLVRPDDHRRNVWIMPDRSASKRRSASSRTTVPDRSDTIIPRALPVVKTSTDMVSRIHAFEGHQRAFVKIQDGCNAHCTYCIIPRLRPKLRSKPIDAAVREAAELVARGYKEIILTGVFLGAYGRETAVRKRFHRGRSPLAELVTALSAIDGLHRLRLSSLEPGDVDAALLEALSGSDRCVPHLHLPLQSGSAEILRRMNRQYTRDAFVDMIDRVRATLDRPAITTDIIVGFPGETDAHFEESLEVARYAGFSKIHAFPFSPRDRTAAARWTERFVSTQTARERMQALAALEAELSLSFRRQWVGKVERVIVESELPAGDATDEPMVSGRCDRYFMIHVEDDPAVTCEIGDVVNVRIERVTGTHTHGSLNTGRRGVLTLPVLSHRPSSTVG